MESRNCAQVLESFIELGNSGDMPWVLLRPRNIDAATVFDGDFDFLIDETRFAEILSTVFFACRAAGVSFVLRQLSAFKRQIDLLERDGRSVTLELWTHAEFRSSDSHDHFTRAAVGYQAYRAVKKNERRSLLAAIFVLHLHHKKKSLRLDLVRARLAYFLQLPDLAPELRDVLRDLGSGASDLGTAHGLALAYLGTHGIRCDSPWRVLANRSRWAVGNVVKWPALHTTAVVGPDGSGKTALITDIKQGPLRKRFRFQRFKRFLRRPFFHLVQSEPRNVRDEKMLWLVLPGAWIYFSLSRWFTGWGRPLLLDRYFYDYFVRNVRSHTLPFRRIAAYGLCSLLAPRPERLIIASCPTAIIHERKQEMTEASIDRMYEVYLDQVNRGRIPVTLFCHTGNGLEISALQAVRFLHNPELA
jgi:hypothetical protein